MKTAKRITAAASDSLIRSAFTFCLFAFVAERSSRDKEATCVPTLVL